MENKNTIIALVLMLAVWMGFSFLFPPAPQQPAPEQVESARVESPGKVEPAPAVAPVSVPGVNYQAAEERELVIETDSYVATLTSVGAKLKTFYLKDYRETADSDSPLLSLAGEASGRYATLRTVGTEGLGLSGEALYALSVDESRIVLGSGETRDIIFTHALPSGLIVEKKYSFSGDSYLFDLGIRLVNGGSSAVRGGIALSLIRSWDDAAELDAYTFTGPATLAGEEVHTDDVEDLDEEGPRNYGTDVVWTAFEDKYFIGAAIPLDGSAEKVRVRKSDDVVENVLESPYRSLQAGESFGLDYKLYFGPRDIDILKGIGHDLEEAIDFGFFALLSRPLLHALNFFYSFVGNYGVAIILLTTVIKLLFWPLTQKSYTSMKAMQVLQPEMAKLREKFKDDKMRLNQEMMGLYKEHRVNPLGGCLPMLVQIPVFFALYQVLLGNIALRHAPFALWVTDLSAKDPYYITPLIMGATMFVQQKLTPSTMDPTQAKIFMLMPVIFTVMFLNFPSGLVLYWLINNLLTILQQYLIHKQK